MLPLELLPVVPAMAAIGSSQTAVGVLDTRLPPGSAAALAFHSGFTYPVAPRYGLSTLGPPVGPPVTGPDVTGPRVVTGADVTGPRVVTGAEVTGPRVVTGAEVTGPRVVTGAEVWTGPPLQATPLTENAVGLPLV